MNLESVQSAYKRYSSFYDVVFGKVFQPGRLLAVKIINETAPVGAKILEVGVGTGLSLPSYRADLKVTGVDISKEMLAKARERLQTDYLPADIELLEMDAENLQFPEQNFHSVVGMYVASVVPDVNRFLNEITRVCVPGGNIVIVNHFASQNSLIRAIEKRFSVLQKIVGFRSDFSMDPILEHPKLELIKIHKTNLLNYWQLLLLKNK